MCLIDNKTWPFWFRLLPCCPELVEFFCLLLVYLILKDRFEGLFYDLYELDSQKRHAYTSLKAHNVHILILGVSPPNRLNCNLNFVYTVSSCIMLLYTVKDVGLEKYWNFNCNGFRMFSLNVCLTFCSTIWYISFILNLILRISPDFDPVLAV